MSRIDKEVIVDAPIESVFSFVNNPENILDIWPSLLTVFNYEPVENGGYKTEYEFTMGGMKFKGKAVCNEFVLNRWMVINTKGISHSTITCTFRSLNNDTDKNKTRVTLTIEYEVPIPLLGQIAEYVIVKASDQEAGEVMENLRARFSTD